MRAVEVIRYCGGDTVGEIRHEIKFVPNADGTATVFFKELRLPPGPDSKDGFKETVNTTTPLDERDAADFWAEYQKDGGLASGYRYWRPAAGWPSS
jgi:hypothetical protein